MHRLYSTLLATGLAVAASQVHAIDFEKAEAGAGVTDGRLTFGPHTYILPAGDWVVAARSGGQISYGNTNRPGPDTGQVVLVSTNANGVRAFFLLEGTMNSSQAESWNAQPCAVNEVWFKDQTGSRLSHPDCLWVRPVGGKISPAWKGILGEAGQYADGKSLAQPDGYVLTQYSKYIWGDFLRGYLFINPAEFGYSPKQIFQMKDAPENIRTWSFNTASSLRTAMKRDLDPVTLPDFAGSK